MVAFLSVLSFVFQTISSLFSRFLHKVGIGTIGIDNFMFAFASFSLFMRYILGSISNSVMSGKDRPSRDQRRRTQK